MQTPVLYILYKMAPMLPIGTNRLFTLRAAPLVCVQGIRPFTPTGSSISPDNSDLSIVFSQNFYIFPVFSVHWGLSGFQGDAVTASPSSMTEFGLYLLQLLCMMHKEPFINSKYIGKKRGLPISEKYGIMKVVF